MTNTLLSFNGNEYELDRVWELAHTGPTIRVMLHEIDLEKTAVIKGELNERQQHDEEYDLPIFYKYAGKMLVLRGKSKIEREKGQGSTLWKGLLLTSPTLKRAKVLSADVQWTDPGATQERAVPQHAPVHSFTTPGRRMSAVEVRYNNLVQERFTNAGNTPSAQDQLDLQYDAIAQIQQEQPRTPQGVRTEQTSGNQPRARSPYHNRNARG